MTFADILSGITEDDIVWVLKKGSGFVNGKIRIYDFFCRVLGTSERAEFLKNEYGIGGQAPIFAECRHSGLHYDSKGLTIEKEGESKRLKWAEVADRIGGLIEDNKYRDVLK